jgi:hypothetical protein
VGSPASVSAFRPAVEAVDYLVRTLKRFLFVGLHLGDLIAEFFNLRPEFFCFSAAAFLFALEAVNIVIDRFLKALDFPTAVLEGAFVAECVPICQTPRLLSELCPKVGDGLIRRLCVRA